MPSTNKENDAHIYSAWRKHEAYQVPVTEDGEYKAMQRFESFKAGWLQAEQRMKGKNKEKHMKVEAKDFGTNQQWKELGSDIAKLKGDVDCLAVKVDRVHSSAHELLRFIDTVKVITLTAIMFLMTYLLVTQFIG